MNLGAGTQSDDLLLPFIGACSEAESEAALEHLVLTHAQPLIREVVGFKLRATSRWRGAGDDREEVDEVAGEVLVRLLRTLRDYKSSQRAEPIASLRGYVAAMAYNASDQYLRRKYPRRHSLKNRLRYVLTHAPGLELWEGENQKVLCGLTSWGHPKAAGAETLREGLDEYLGRRFPGVSPARLNPSELVAAVLGFVDSPLELDELVRVVAEVTGVRDARPRSEQEVSVRGDMPQPPSDPRGALDDTLDRRARLCRTWEEILLLPPRQRAALLLNLREEGGGAAVALLPLLRVATMRQIAEALGMPAEELAEVWGRLPLEDAAIGERLGATRQQVANLRKCARERLARRLRAAGAG